MNINCPYCHTPNFTELEAEMNDCFVCSNCHKTFYPQMSHNRMMQFGGVAAEDSKSSGNSDFLAKVLSFISILCFISCGICVALSVVLIVVTKNGTNFAIMFVAAFVGLIFGLLFRGVSMSLNRGGR